MGNQYCACCVDDEEVYFYGLGETPDDAYREFIEKGDFDDQCDALNMESGDSVEVYIYTTCEPEESDWPEEEREPHWTFVLDKKTETRLAKAP